MSRVLLFIIILFFALLLKSCSKTATEKSTTGKGRVTNKITGEGVAGIPVEIWECEPGFYFGGDRCNTIMSALTDNKGNYSITFLSSSNRFYKAAIGSNNKVEASTNYSVFRLVTQKINEVNFSAVPVKILQLRLQVLRNDKNSFNISYHTSDSNGNWHGGPIWNDETARFHFIDTTFYLYVFALRNYRFSAGLCNKTGPYTYINCETFNKDVYINNVDTSRVEFRIQ